MSAIEIMLVIFGFLGMVFTAVLFWVIRALVTQEVAHIVPALTYDLLRRAAERLPDEHREHLLEEWRAEIEDMAEKRPLLALSEAVSLHRGARRIARELEPASVPAGITGIPKRIGTLGNGIAGYILGSSRVSFALFATVLTLCVVVTTVAIFALLELVLGL
jgi:hypothetical protein